MPRTRRSKPLYRRGQFALHPREGRNLQIIWYDSERKRERCASAGTSELEEGKIAVDRLFLASTGGGSTCPTCGQTVGRGNALVASIIADYLTAHGSQQSSADAIAARLDHVLRYIEQLKDPGVRAANVTEAWIASFRTWLEADPYHVGKAQEVRYRSPATIENSVIQLAAALRWHKEDVHFEPIPLKELSRTPEYRADVATIAAMFRYCLDPDAKTPKQRERMIRGRLSLLAFLRHSIVTWGRPDAILDSSTAPKRGQWFSSARVFNLNPVGRRQTRKYRAMVPVPECVAWWYDSFSGPIMPKTLSKSTWHRMEVALGLPGAGQSGMKLIRRSIATIARKPDRLGEEHWIQGRIMLGHVQPTTSDIYAVQDPTHLGRALAVTTAIIGEVEKLAPGAFYRDFTALGSNVASLHGGRNG
jgi:hypothetical protein